MWRNQQQISNFNNSSLIQSLVITSDPQYPWTDCTDSPGCKEDESTKGRRSEELIREQYNNINSYTVTVPNASIIINGDLTAFGHGWQWNKMNSLLSILNRPYYYGLGNHDIENNKGDCFDDACFKNSMNFLIKHVKYKNLPSSQFNYKSERVGSILHGYTEIESGSFAYVVNFRNICSMQLNNFPTMSAQSASIGHSIRMFPDLDWVENQLARAKNQGKTIIVHVHKPDAWAGGPNQRFKDLLKNYGVAAVFCGHYHTRCGEYTSSYANYFGGIPVFLSGSASQRTYLILEHFSDKLNIYTVKSNDWRNNRQLVSSIDIITPARFQIVTALDNSSVVEMDRNNENVLLWTNNGGNHQKWDFIYDPQRNAYLILNVYNPNIALSADAPRTYNVFGHNVAGYDSQYWILEPVANGYIFRNYRNQNLVMDVDHAMTTKGTNIKLNTQHPAISPYRNAQIFSLTPV